MEKVQLGGILKWIRQFSTTGFELLAHCAMECAGQNFEEEKSFETWTW